MKDKNRDKPPLAYVGAAHSPLDLWDYRFLSELKSALPHTNHALFRGLIIRQRTINHACGEKPIRLPNLAEKLRGFLGHEFSVIGLPLRSAMIFLGFCGANMPKACPYYVGVGRSRIVYILFIALRRVVAFRKEGGGMSAGVYRELAHKENHALIPPGAEAPTLRKGFIEVFVRNLTSNL